ncbi:MAG: enoyl-CoA hydratase/isomerase family protein [Hyphomicrobiales bacterium]|nr:enoyl-CoA hydratase/isomerase family protein [Hyphomicrobiales bacterium]
MSGQARVELRFEERNGGKVAFVTIDNLAKLNALSSPVMEDFVRKVDACGADSRVRAVVVTGAGARAFVGGADISEMSGLDSAKARAFITRVHGCCDVVRRCPVPVIARVNGHCYGAGMELAAACDMRIAAASARFGMPEVKLGIPSVVEAAVLPQLVGWGRTRELLLLGETYAAQECADWGFLERVVPDDALDREADKALASILACGPNAIRLQKELIARWETQPLPQAIRTGIDTFARAYESDEPGAMMNEFLKHQAARKNKAQ